MVEEIYTEEWLEQVKADAERQYLESRIRFAARYHQQLADLLEFRTATIAVAQEAYDKAQSKEP